MPQESGIRELRLEFIRETTRGITPTNPDWLLYSDAVQSFGVTPTASIAPRGNIGTPDIVNFNAGTESHSFSVSYDLQQWFTSTTDAAYDGMARLPDGSLPASHTMVGRASAGHVGTAGGGSRIYYVATGGLVNSVNLGGEPESGDPIIVSLEYNCEKLRSYLIDQPAGATQLTIVSTDTADTTQSVTVEDDTAAIAEALSLNGTTPVVSTSVLFATLDAVFLDGQTKGDVTVTDGSNQLMIIYGSDSYNGREGDLGVPALGSGSHATALATAFESILGDTIERPAATALGIDACISSASMSVDNAVEANSCISQIGQILSEGTRTVTLNASLIGPKPSYDSMVDHLRATENNIVWSLTGGTLTLVGAALTDLGTISRETAQAVLSVDNTFQGKSLTITAA